MTVFDQLSDELAKRAYDGARVSFLAVEKGSGLQNLHCRVVLAPRTPESSWSANLSVGQYFICKKWLYKRELEQALSLLPQGRLPLRDKELLLLRPDSTPYSWGFYEYLSDAKEKIGWPTHCLRGIGENVARVAGEDVRGALDRRLLGWSRGTLGSYRQLCRLLGKPDAPFALPGSDPSFMEVLVPTYCRIESAALSILDSRLTVELSTDDHTLPMQLYAIHDAADAPLRFGPEHFTRHDGCWRLETVLERLEGAWDLRLMAGDETVDESRVGLPKLSNQAHALIDPNGQWLTGLLDDAKGNRGADGFEHYVVTLLQLCGVPAVRYGFKSPTGAPDIVAELGEDAMLVAECKVVVPTTDMIESLAGRARSIASAVTTPGRLTTHVAFFHPKPRRLVPSVAGQVAGHQGVYLVGLEQLTAVQVSWQRGEPPSLLLAQLLG